MKKVFENLHKRIAKAVSHYWLTREQQANKQKNSSRVDQGLRSAVTGGAQMDDFIALITEIILEAGVDEKHIFHNKNLELPGFSVLQKNGT